MSVTAPPTPFLTSVILWADKHIETDKTASTPLHVFMALAVWLFGIKIACRFYGNMAKQEAVRQTRCCA